MRRAAALLALLGASVIACDKPRGTPQPTDVPGPVPSAAGVKGVAIDAATDEPLAGVTVRVDGLGETSTGQDGVFHLAATGPEQVRSATITSPTTVDRVTHVRAPGPSATLSLIGQTFDLQAFDQMCRSSGAIVRWVQTPAIVVQTRVLGVEGDDDTTFPATGSVVSDADLSAWLADFAWAIPQLSGQAMTRFANESRETAAEGARVDLARTGRIVVARVQGLAAERGAIGLTRWAWNGANEIQVAVILLDADFDTSAADFKRSVRAHELGHALGFGHVTSRASVMNLAGRLEPNAFDLAAGKIAFRRPPMNRSPDVDPDGYTLSRVRTGPLTWAELQ
jgi:hypothetical protein